jgi:hypothetical protein
VKNAVCPIRSSAQILTNGFGTAHGKPHFLFLLASQERVHIERDSSIKNPIETRYAMSDDEDKYVIEVADAGASDTIPCEAGAIKKGG